MTLAEIGTRELFDEVHRRIRSKQIASCRCRTKTPDPRLHATHCLYRLLDKGLQQIAFFRGVMTTD